MSIRVGLPKKERCTSLWGRTLRVVHATEDLECRESSPIASCNPHPTGPVAPEALPVHRAALHRAATSVVAVDVDAAALHAYHAFVAVVVAAALTFAQLWRWTGGRTTQQQGQQQPKATTIPHVSHPPGRFQTVRGYGAILSCQSWGAGIRLFGKVAVI